MKRKKQRKKQKKKPERHKKRERKKRQLSLCTVQSKTWSTRQTRDTCHESLIVK